MKKTFVLTHPKIKKDRLFEAAIHEVRKYIKREQRKELPKNYDYWDFDCKYGKTAEEAKTIHQNDISKHILEAQKEDLESFYVEVLAKPCARIKKPKDDSDLKA